MSKIDIKNQSINNWKDKEPNNNDSKEVEEGFLDYLRRWIGTVPFALEAVALYLLFIDPNYPTIKKGVAVFALLYFIAPLDAIPDITPVVGFLDDAGVIASAVYMYNTDIEPYREKAEDWLVENGFR